MNCDRKFGMSSLFKTEYFVVTVTLDFCLGVATLSLRLVTAVVSMRFFMICHRL